MRYDRAEGFGKDTCRNGDETQKLTSSGFGIAANLWVENLLNHYGESLTASEASNYKI